MVIIFEFHQFRVGAWYHHLCKDRLQQSAQIEVTAMKAAGDSLFLVLAISWILTMIFIPSAAADNPLKARGLGYNILCVGWDFAPANYVAAVLWITVA
jgi:hypothetical protein